MGSPIPGVLAIEATFRSVVPRFFVAFRGGRNFCRGSVCVFAIASSARKCGGVGFKKARGEGLCLGVGLCECDLTLILCAPFFVFFVRCSFQFLLFCK